MAPTNFGNYTFDAYSLLTGEEKSAVRGPGAIELFNGKDPVTLRSRAERQAQLGNDGLSAALSAVAERLEAGMVPYFIQAKAADEAAQAVAFLAAKPRAKELVDHWGSLIARAERVTSSPVLFA